MVWLHGTLYITLLEARDLVNDTNLGHFIPSHLPGKLGQVDTGKVGKMLSKGFGKMMKAAEGQIGELASYLRSTSASAALSACSGLLQVISICV